MNQKRSNKFDYFTNDKDPVEKKKSLLKKVWYWLKISLYVLVFGLTITGCVQSIAIKTSGETGAGLELYRNKEDIAPKVKSFLVEEKELIKKDNSKDAEVIKLPTITAISEENILIKNKDILNLLREQTKNNKGEYGAYNSFNSAIRIKKDGKELTGSEIYKDKGRFLFDVSNTKEYQPITTFTNIYTFANAVDVETQKDAASPLKSDKNDTNKITWVSGISKIDNDFKAYDIANLKNELEAKEKGKKDYVIYYKSKALFSRDILQIFYNLTFTDQKWKDLFDNKDPSTFIKENIIDKFKNNQEVRLTYVQKEGILTYHKLLSAQLNELGFAKTLTLGYDASNKYDIDIRHSHVPGAAMPYSNAAQKPITTWSESWGLGPFYGLIVYPISYVSQALRQSLPDLSGWSTIFVIIIVVVIIKAFSLLITFKSIVGQSIQEDLRGKKAQIEAKYKDFGNNKMMKARKQQELQKLYKKNNINPLDQFLSVIVSMPIFFAMWRVIQCMPEIKSTIWLGLNFSSTSYSSLFAGQWQYLGIIVIAVGVQLVSQILPRLLNRRRLKERISIAENEALKKSEKTQRIVMIVFLVITLMFTAGVQVYWIITGLWTIGQTIGIHYLKKSAWWRTKYSKKFKA
ncbi:membrane protein insertase YidC [Mycoplasma crocodyli]|uniref:60 kDa inner membrane protein n=1 Tax=Mycoplasma crocodyli (strain ATCC 51981 / MP145) TaxID=512564 RepID=D5E6G0_MYCCM|nr:membrane protein insertase YidC [Mycoplasma crocodyli]ADE19633.1 60 kDa inner membrane protein [Mycoplasma crocodyli MP145]